MLLVQSEAASEITHIRAKHNRREQVRAARDKLPLEIPSVDAAVACVARSGDDVVVFGLLRGDEGGDEFRLFLRG